MLPLSSLSLLSPPISHASCPLFHNVPIVNISLCPTFLLASSICGIASTPLLSAIVVIKILVYLFFRHPHPYVLNIFLSSCFTSSLIFRVDGRRCNVDAVSCCFRLLRMRQKKRLTPLVWVTHLLLLTRLCCFSPSLISPILNQCTNTRSRGSSIYSFCPLTIRKNPKFLNNGELVK